MITTNQDFWSYPEIVKTQHADSPFLYWYEKYLLHARCLDVGTVHVVGCGSGRELPGILQSFPNAKVIASDLSSAMIEACRSNLQKWHCEDRIELHHMNAGAIDSLGDSIDLVITFNNMFTYITPKEEREKSMAALRRALKKGGWIIGCVHYRFGRVLKSGYFALQLLLIAFGFLEPSDAGDRIGKICGLKGRWHYFRHSELKKLLEHSGFTPLEIVSLENLAKAEGRKCNPLFGDNNLIFSAKAV